MKFNIEQKKFNNAINYVERAVSSKNTMPILTGIYIEVKDDKLHLIATNLELGIECWIDNVEVIEEGTIVLPSKYLSSLVRELPDEIIKIKIDPESFSANLKCSDSVFEINGFDPDEFPQLPEVENPETLTISADKLSQIINKVKFSISNDESQPALTGALLEVNNNSIVMVSTNTYRLSYCEKKLNQENQNLEDENIKIIIPGNTLNELNRLLPDDQDTEVEILINSNYSCFKFNEITVISRLIEGQFPNYDQVIPDEYNTRVQIEKSKFQQAVKRASLIAQNNSNIISLSTSLQNNKIVIDSMEAEAGEAHEEVDIEINGPEQNIRIDAGYLLDALKIMNEEEIIVDLIGPLNPLTIKNENDYVYLIMPIRSD